MPDSTNYRVMATELAQRIQAMPIGSAAGIFGRASDRDTALLGLRKTAAVLVQDMYAAKPKTALLARVDELEGALQTAQLVGLVSDSELTQYLADLDAVHTAIDKEKN